MEDLDVNDYIKALQRSGLKITKQRKLILQVLTATSSHPEAMDLFKEVRKVDKDISLSTVYRTMRALEEQGCIQRHSFAGGPARFEAIGQAHHDHLIDVDSGQIIEFHSTLLERLQKQISEELGYDLVSHRLELYGRAKPGIKK